VESILEPEAGKPASIAVEELFLPRNILDETMKTLEQSNALLPCCARNFKEWRVGLLGRYERSHPTAARDGKWQG
jgi:hypothetical protein